MTTPLAGTVAIVTGASSGIGEATALSFAQNGATVVIAARRRDRLESLSARIGEAGGTGVVVECDVTDEAQARGLVDRTVKELGRLDILINNAGVMLLGKVEGAKTAQWRRMLDLNVVALMNLSHAALPHLIAAAEQEPRRVADIVNVSSVAGRVARVGSGAYNASKWAVNAFTEALRQEVTERHLRVGLIEPGAVDTELGSHNTDPEVVAGMHRRFGTIQRMTAEDIAAAVLFMVTRPRHVAINELLVRPTEQVG